MRWNEIIAEKQEAAGNLEERAPHTKKGEKFIKKHKAEFKKRYGDRWKQMLYSTAWKLFGE